MKVPPEQDREGTIPLRGFEHRQERRVQGPMLHRGEPSRISCSDVRWRIYPHLKSIVASQTFGTGRFVQRS